MGKAKEDFERLAEYNYDKKTAESEWILRQLINQPLGKKFVNIVSGADLVMIHMQDVQDNPEYQKNGTDGVQCIYSEDYDEGLLAYNKRRTPEDGEYIHQILQLSDIEGKTYAEQKLLAIKRLIESEIEANKVFGMEEDHNG
jgi:hypothetical protein